MWCDSGAEHSFWDSQKLAGPITPSRKNRVSELHLMAQEASPAFLHAYVPPQGALAFLEITGVAAKLVLC